MTDKGAQEGRQFLTVAQAAEKLNQPRLRIREAVARGLLPGRRDNEGRLRVDLPEVFRLNPDKAEVQLEPTALVELLFDEIEDLQAHVETGQSHNAQLQDLVVRQSKALEAADAQLDAAEGQTSRLSGLLDTALSHLEDERQRVERLTAVSDRALTQLERLGEDLEGSLSQTASFEDLLTRAMQVAEAQSGADALGSTTERAFDLLEGALVRAEAGEHAQARSDALLDRALTAGERMQQDIARKAQAISQKDVEIETHRGTIEQALTMSERAVEVATKELAETPRKRGFFRRIFGR